MTNRFSTRNSLRVAATFAFIGLAGCNPEEDMNPGAELSAEASLMAQGVHPGSNVKLRKNHYVVLSSSEKLPAGIASNLRAANGEITSLMEEAGVATVYSEDPNFASKAAKINGVRSVVRDLEVQWYNPDDMKIVELGEVGTPPASGDNDSYFDLQWGHAAIKAPQA